MKSVVAVLCAVCFLAFAQGAVTQALAAEEWETWPKKTPESQAGGAAEAGKAGGEKTYAGMSAGTVGWIALGTAAVIGIAIAAGSGGGGSSSNH